MKRIFLLICVLVSVQVFGQYVQFPTSAGIGYYRMGGTINLWIPSDTLTPTNQLISFSHIAMKGTSLYYWNGSKWNALSGGSGSGLTSVGLSMPSAFTVTNSPLTSDGTIAVTGAGTTSQYIRGDGSLGSSLPSALIPTWQQTLTAGSTLTGPNTIDGGTNDFSLSNMGATEISTVGGGVVGLLSTKTGSSSQFVIWPDSIVSKPDRGGYYIDTLNHSTTATDKMMVWDSVGQKVATRAIPSGGGLTIGNAVSGGGTNRVLYEDASQNLAASSGFTFDGSTILSIPASGKIKSSTTQAIYIPDQSTITGSMVFGNGGTGLSNAGGGTNGQYNNLIGYDAGTGLVNGWYNTIVGRAMYYSAHSTRNTAMGHNALFGSSAADSSDYNTAVGYSSHNACTNCRFNTSLGSSSLLHGTTDTYNTAIGVNALHELVSGDANTALGLDAGWNLIGSSSRNVLLGRGAGRNLLTVDNNLVIGYKAMAIPYNQSNTMNIANLIFATSIDEVDSTISDGKVGIGVIAPSQRLEVDGQVKATSFSGRWVARVGNTTSSATPTINTDSYDIYKLTAQAADITSFTTNLSGTPNDGDVLEIQITGTAARAITWGSSFVATTVALPTTTVTTVTLTTIFQYYTTSSYGNNKWLCVNSY